MLSIPRTQSHSVHHWEPPVPSFRAIQSINQSHSYILQQEDDILIYNIDVDLYNGFNGLILLYWMGLPIRYIHPEGWLGKLGDGSLADVILDRIKNSYYTILLIGRLLREYYSKIK